MKTITEFSGTVIRMATNAVSEAKAALPKEAPAAPVEAAAPVEGAAPAEGEAAPVAAAAPGESAAAAAALDEAVTKATGLSGDRLARLREALKAVGGKTADVRVVRVFAGEEPVPGATKIGEHQYVVDVMPASMKPSFARPEKERGGRSGGGIGSKGGAHGGSKEGAITGGFSMDSLKDDRGGKRGPGGGKGGPGGPGRGGPKA